VKSQQRRLFILDTNVLMHDPTAIFRFEEHDIYLPMVVIEELDSNKKGMSEAGRRPTVLPDQKPDRGVARGAARPWR
jgi:predicted ribonuclease YlaK